jgi:hypothetical protein
VEQTADKQLGMMAELVDAYGNEIPGLISSLKKMHIGDDDKSQADLIFTTVHRCKGMEYDVVRLADDFLTEEALLKQLEEDRSPAQIRRLTEEVNLLYVAVTRTRNLLIIPESMEVPGMPHSSHIRVMRNLKQEAAGRKGGKSAPARGTATRRDADPKPRAASRNWTAADDRQLAGMYHAGKTLKDMVLHFERSASAIQMRIR